MSAMTASPASAYEQTRDALAPRLASQRSDSLCMALLALDGPGCDKADRIVRSLIVKELCGRHPEVSEALLRWSADPAATGSEVEVVVEAAQSAGHR